MQAVSALAPNDAAVDDAAPASRGLEPALPFRSDTILGVCEAIGQDFSFNPIYLRLAFAGLFYFHPLMVVATYLALGAGVALARWLYPVVAPTLVQEAPHAAAPAAENEDSQPSLAA
ncbi:MAG: PspC domain-containing protein [Sphingomonas sp.]|nr:PspC domain-containing protein [Sphingomonas sp.]